MGALFFTIVALFLKLAFKKLRQARAKYKRVWRYIVVIMGVVVGVIITLVSEAKGVGYEYVSRLFNNEFYSYHALLIKDIMSEKPFVIHKNSSNDDIFKAISILNVTQIPFVDENRLYLGMLDLNRFLKELSLCKIDYKIR